MKEQPSGGMGEHLTVLRAWWEVFGTTQLTHARARLESAEEKVASQSATIARLEAERERLKSSRDEAVSNHIAFRDATLKTTSEMVERIHSLESALAEKQRVIGEVGDAINDADHEADQGEDYPTVFGNLMQAIRAILPSTAADPAGGAGEGEAEHGQDQSPGGGGEDA